MRTIRSRVPERPVFWWVAGGIFLVNAWISLATGLWLVAVLQALTALWALVAGVSAWHTAPRPDRDDLAPRP